MTENRKVNRPLLSLYILCLLWGCKPDPQAAGGPLPFDQAQWVTKEGRDYPYRERMVDAVLYSDTLRKLKKGELLQRLGTPDREQDGHLYYTIAQNRLGFWTLNQKSIVIKLNGAEGVEWIKLYE